MSRPSDLLHAQPTCPNSNPSAPLFPPPTSGAAQDSPILTAVSACCGRCHAARETAGGDTTSKRATLRGSYPPDSTSVSAATRSRRTSINMPRISESLAPLLRPGGGTGLRAGTATCVFCISFLFISIHFD